MLQTDTSRYNYYLSLLLLYFLLLPMNGTVLVVWARNLIARWKLLEPFGSDHDALFVLPVLAVCELCSAGKMLTPASKLCVGCWLIVPIRDMLLISSLCRSHRMSRLAEMAFTCTAVYAFVCGGRFTYGVYEFAMASLGILAVWHVRPSS
jgi:hypothetical protein